MNKDKDGFVVLFAIALLVSPLVYVGLQDSGDNDGERYEEDYRVSIGERQSLYSEVLDEDREYLVYLPGSYNDDTYSQRSFPVLYLLDGDAHFHSVTGVVEFLSADANGTRRIPEMIIVAIPNTDRTRDLTPTHTMVGYTGEEQEFLTNSGGGDSFLRFLNEELFTEIESDYRTLPHRTLVGHSFGGLLALHALVNAPGMFQNHIAIDPSLWWHEQSLVAEAAEAFGPQHAYRGAVFISLANNREVGQDDLPVMESAGRDFAAILAAVNDDKFTSSMTYYNDDDHGSVPLISFYDGLQSAFDYYDFDYEQLVENPGYITEHYAQVAARMGIDFPPPESSVNGFGYYLVYAIEDLDAAVNVFRMNVDLYPESYNTWDSLADAYQRLGETELAIENFKRSLELNPDNEHAREEIALLSESGSAEQEPDE